jgi:hypothetical protein
MWKVDHKMTLRGKNVFGWWLDGGGGDDYDDD